MNKYSIIALLFIVSTQTISALIQQEWDTFKLQYHKKYESATEEQFRQKIFMYNHNKIVQHNAEYSQGLVSFKMSINEYADELHTMFKARNGLKIGHVLNFTKTGRPEGLRFLHPVNVKLEDSVDWRKTGAVTPVKNQGTCGSCWAFSAVGSLEAQHFRKTGVLVSLSEQNLLDCTRPYGNHGCQGGFVDLAFEYIKENHGIDTAKSYPYEGEEKTCHFNPKTIGSDEAGFVDIPHGDEEALKAAVATVGPVSIVIDASHQSLMFYSEGIYDEPQCSPDVQDHAVLIVGYGTEDGKDYWLVKNSWGESWGNKGYIKMSRNKNNQCGIATTASYPIV